MVWNDIYELPLKVDSYSNWVWDKNNNFVFQFKNVNRLSIGKIIDILNGEDFPKNDIDVKHEDGYILANGTKIILIRGWGNLMGRGGHNLSGEDATNIQDTFAEYIVDRLTLKNK